MTTTTKKKQETSKPIETQEASPFGFSEKTKKILNNFSTINANLTFQKGNVLRTTSPSHDIFALCEIDEEIPSDFSIYNLKELLSSIKLMSDSEFNKESSNTEIIFSKGHLLLKGNGTRMKYRYCDPSSCEPVPKGINMPPADCTIEISKNEIMQIQKTSMILGHNHFSVYCEGDGETKVCLYDIKDQENNPWTMCLEDSGKIEVGIEFKFVLNITSINVIIDDYKVQFSSKGITQWTSKNLALQYWILLNANESYWGGK